MLLDNLDLIQCIIGFSPESTEDKSTTAQKYRGTEAQRRRGAEAQRPQQQQLTITTNPMREKDYYNGLYKKSLI